MGDGNEPDGGAAVRGSSPSSHYLPALGKLCLFPGGLSPSSAHYGGQVSEGRAW
jgi:hypothetical protein